MYSEKVMDHFANPRNSGIIENASGEGTVGNPTCGDLMTIYIDVDENEVIQDIKFETFGCGAAIVDEALEITRNDVADALDGLPPIKMHCSNLAADALTEAIKDYKAKKEE